MYNRLYMYNPTKTSTKQLYEAAVVQYKRTVYIYICAENKVRQIGKSMQVGM